MKTGCHKNLVLKRKFFKKKKEKKTAPDPPKYINKSRKWKFFQWKIVSFI